MRLMWVPLYSKLQMVLSRECCRRFSWGSKSETVVPRARLPRPRVAPACSSSVSTSEVLPAPACPTSAMLRMPEVVYPMTVAPPAKKPAAHGQHRPPRAYSARPARGYPSSVGAISWGGFLWGGLPCPHGPCPRFREIAGVHHD